MSKHVAHQKSHGDSARWLQQDPQQKNYAYGYRNDTFALRDTIFAKSSCLHFTGFVALSYSVGDKPATNDPKKYLVHFLFRRFLFLVVLANYRC